jgi:IclR family KDG regulon transcriptional repressor
VRRNILFEMSKLLLNNEIRSPAVVRVAQILEWLAIHPEGATLTEIGKALELPLTTVYETLCTLVGLRFVNKDSGNGRYTMGVRMLEIGMSYLSRTSLVQAFHVAARDVVRATGETVQLAVRDGRDVLYIAEVDGTRSIRVVTDIGRRLPCHTASTGKAILACLPDTEIMRLYRDAPLQRLTTHSVGSLSALLKELRAVRRRGYAVDVQETYEGIQCVGAAVYGAGRTAVAGISITMPYSPTNLRRVREIASAVRAAAAAISRQLRPPAPLIVGSVEARGLLGDRTPGEPCSTVPGSRRQ